VTFERAREADVDEIQRVAAQSWHAMYKGIFPPEFIEDFLARAYSTEGLLRSINSPDGIFLVARHGARLSGFCHYGQGRQGPELFRIYVLPEYWRTGVGAGFLDRLEAMLVERAVREYHCYVHSRNEVGKAFYLKRGFVHQASRDHNEEWCMVRVLPEAEPSQRR
jgi:GNAT superfamily N-acetyltransferase